MADQFRAEHERRAFARLTMQVPVELHQGGQPLYPYLFGVE